MIELKPCCVRTTCSCGCVEIHFDRIDFDGIEPMAEPEYCLSFFINKFYSGQNHFKAIIKRIKIALIILFKGTYRYEEIILTQDDYCKLVDELQKMQKESEEK